MSIFLSIGTGPGMGIATARRFAQEGFRVILSARNEGRVQALADGLKAEGFDAEALVVDASNTAAVAKLVAEVEEHYDPIDVLHYNAANLRKSDIAAQPTDTFVPDLAVNIGGDSSNLASNGQASCRHHSSYRWRFRAVPKS
jgi:NAD(P)-dependent dehydrogenase (short-subunit alcohol dehydrogenase family)